MEPDGKLRPAVPKDTHQGSAIHSGEGRILVSAAMQSYRIFVRNGDRCDKKVRWNAHSSREAAWAAALDLIARG